MLQCSIFHLGISFSLASKKESNTNGNSSIHIKKKDEMTIISQKEK
jgi:hypothetical protein